MADFEVTQAQDHNNFHDSRLVHECIHSYLNSFYVWVVHKNNAVSATLAQPSRITKTAVRQSDTTTDLASPIRFASHIIATITTIRTGTAQSISQIRLRPGLPGIVVWFPIDAKELSVPKNVQTRSGAIRSPIRWTTADVSQLVKRPRHEGHSPSASSV
jgi:hypothetical protein